MDWQVQVPKENIVICHATGLPRVTRRVTKSIYLDCFVSSISWVKTSPKPLEHGSGLSSAQVGRARKWPKARRRQLVALIRKPRRGLNGLWRQLSTTVPMDGPSPLLPNFDISSIRQQGSGSSPKRVSWLLPVVRNRWMDGRYGRLLSSVRRRSNHIYMYVPVYMYSSLTRIIEQKGRQTCKRVYVPVNFLLATPGTPTIWPRGARGISMRPFKKTSSSKLVEQLPIAETRHLPYPLA
jgi:hypothetical protein